MRVHHTMGVYANGDRVHNGVLASDLQGHIKYNLAMRPGRAFFVDGKCMNTGYLGEEKCALIEQELADNPVQVKHAVPYR